MIEDGPKGFGFWSENFSSRRAAEARAKKIRDLDSGVSVSVGCVNGEWTVSYQTPDEDYSDLDESAERNNDSRRDSGTPKDSTVVRKDHPIKGVYGD